MTLWSNQILLAGNFYRIVKNFSNLTQFRSISSSRVSSSTHRTRVRSSTNPKTPPHTGPARLMTVSLKDDISTALKNPNSALKIETLEKMKQVVVKTGSLGKLA